MTLITIDAGMPDVPANPIARCRRLVMAGVALVAVFIVGFGIWAAFAPLEIAVIAPGVVVPQANSKVIQHLDGGIIAKILVHDGDHVKAGQTLIRLDDTKARTTYESASDQLIDARAAEARLLAERDDDSTIVFPPGLLARRNEPVVAQALAAQQKIFLSERGLESSKIDAIEERIKQSGAEIDGYQAELAAANQQVMLLTQEVANTAILVKRGLERRARLVELERDLAAMQGTRGNTLAQIARAKETIAEAKVDILSLRNDDQKQAADALGEEQRRVETLTQDAMAAESVMARTDIEAPEDGVVTDLRVHTTGGVIEPGQPLMNLVPSPDPLLIEARARPIDIDRLRPGLKAQIRLLPYKERRTPTLDARVVYVSADRIVDKRTNQPYFLVKLKVDPKMLARIRDVHMVPGMPAETMIQTGESTVALYALSPVIDSFHRAFHEK